MNNKVNSEFYKNNLTKFSSQICEVLSNACFEFWEQEIKIKLHALNDFKEVRDEKIISNIDFFSSQIKVEKHRPIVIRLSKDFIENFLDLTLKSKNQIFELTKLTSLEVRILNSFCEFLYKKIKEILVAPEKIKQEDRKNEKNINFIFFIKSQNDICSKIMLTIPKERINFPELKKIVSFSDIDFTTSTATINLKAGSSKITLEELKNLSNEDIIILENSETSKMTLISGDYEKKFGVKVDKSLVIDLNNDEEETENNFMQTYEEVTMSKNLWDDIQIEINAEFEKVKMTIGELKQISQGQIVDLGSIFNNEISLFVENKKVAKGELLIINDRYAVRINEIVNANPPKAPVQGNIPQQKQPQAPIKPQVKPAIPQQAQANKAPAPAPAQQKARPMPQAQQPVGEDEDFDYSDFEK